MYRLLLLQTLILAFMLGRLSAIQLADVVGKDYATGFAIYFWATGSAALILLTIVLWRKLHRPNLA